MTSRVCLLENLSPDEKGLVAAVIQDVRRPGGVLAELARRLPDEVRVELGL